MLFTRCPDCDTTFRITDAALKKAAGRVRCGRCTSVFDAYAELREADDVADLTSAAPAEHAAAPSSEPRAPAPDTAPADASEARAEPESSDSDEADADAVHVAETAHAADREPDEDLHPFPTHSDGVSRDAVDIMPRAEAPLARGATDWSTLLRPEPALRGRRWAVATALALLALGIQIANHNRSALAGNSTFGPWVQRAYAGLGVRVSPNWDVHQYKILDWTATAEPSSRGLGSLRISARIQNLSPRPQPYPFVQLRLKDRWEDAVGGRLFSPREYLSPTIENDALMSSGETSRASIEVVDPGPDAYGFELDVCIELEASAISCGNDKVFL